MRSESSLLLLRKRKRAILSQLLFSHLWVMSTVPGAHGAWLQHTNENRIMRAWSSCSVKPSWNSAKLSWTWNKRNCAWKHLVRFAFHIGKVSGNRLETQFYLYLPDCTFLQLLNPHSSLELKRFQENLPVTAITGSLTTTAERKLEEGQRVGAFVSHWMWWAVWIPFLAFFNGFAVTFILQNFA